MNGETGSGQLLGCCWVVVDSEVDERREWLRKPPKLATLDGLMGFGSGGGDGGGVPLGPKGPLKYDALFKELLEAVKNAAFAPGEPGGVYGLKTLVGRLKVDRGRELG